MTNYEGVCVGRNAFSLKFINAHLRTPCIMRNILPANPAMPKIMNVYFFLILTMSTILHPRICIYEPGCIERHMGRGPLGGHLGRGPLEEAWQGAPGGVSPGGGGTWEGVPGCHRQHATGHMCQCTQALCVITSMHRAKYPTIHSQAAAGAPYAAPSIAAAGAQVCFSHASVSSGFFCNMCKQY